MGNSKFVLLSVFVVVVVVSSQNDNFIPQQQNNPSAKINIEMYMDKNTDCNSDRIREVGDKVVNVYGHGVGEDNQEGPLSCTIVLNTDSPREPKRFKITIVAMRIRSCGVQFYMYDGSDQGGRIMGSFDCNRGMDQLNGFTLYHSTGSQFGFSLTRQDYSQFDYDIRLHIQPVIASLDWSDGGGWGTGSVYDADKFSQEAIIGIVGGAFLVCIVIIGLFIACYCLRSKGKTLPPREIILRNDFSNTAPSSTKMFPEPSEKVWMSELSSVGNTMKSTKTMSSLPHKGRYQPSDEGSNYSDEVPRHSRRYGGKSDRPRRYEDHPRHDARGYRHDHRGDPPRYEDSLDDRLRRFGRPRGHDRSRFDEYDEEPPMNRNRNRPPPRRGQRTESAFANTSFVEPDEDVNIEKVIEPRVRPKKSTATDPINISDDEDKEELMSEENNESDSEQEEESASEEEEEEEEEESEEEEEKTEKKGFMSNVQPQQHVQLPPQQLGHPPVQQVVMPPQFGTLPPNYQPPPYNVAHTYMPVPLTQQGIPVMAGPVQALPPRYMPAQPHAQSGPTPYQPALSAPRNEQAQKSTPPIYNYLVRRGYTPIDGRSSPVSSSTAASNLSEHRPYHTDDSDQPANIDSGVEFMKRTTDV